MIKSHSFRRILMAVLASVFLYSAVMLSVYSIIAPNIFVSAKIRELLPSARFLAEQTAMYFQRTPEDDVKMLGVDSRQWGASVYIVDQNASIITSTEQYHEQLAYQINYDDFEVLLGEIAAGREVAEMRLMPRIIDGHTDAMDLLIIGLPVYADDEIVGGVVMLKSLEEIISAMSSLLAALWFSMGAVLVGILPIAYLASRRITLPIQQMRNVALRMLDGDFAIRGDDMDRSEIGDLARALNYISAELGRTISDLKRERNQALTIVNALEEGILAVDKNLEPTQTNPALQTMLIVAGNGRRARLPAEVWDDFSTALSEGRSTTRAFPLGDLRIHLTVTPVGTPREGIISAIGVFHDQTQAHRLEQTRRDYVANVSHELRTPLTALRAMIEPLRDGLIKTDEQRLSTYDIILRETMRLTRLVDDMLELSRLQRGRLALEKIRFGIAPLLHDTASIYAAKAATTGHLLTLCLPDSPMPTVLCNPDRTEQVLVALLNNAFTYTPPGAEICLIAEVMEDHLKITVEDNGPGISPEDLPQVFDRFYKADKSHSGTGGTGLGLAIARELMERLGEKIWAENREGGGARFSFTLHFNEAEPPSDEEGDAGALPQIPLKGFRP